MKKAGWIIGIVLAFAASFFLLLLVILAASDTSSPDNGDELSAVQAMALTRRASELFCAGVYYTDKALGIDPKTCSYDKWKEYVDIADEYWGALDETLEALEDGINSHIFDEELESIKSRGNPFIATAYALDSAEIIQVFDSAPAGRRLKTLAKHLGKDMKYAKQALKMANGQITAQGWNDFANTAQKLEAGARVVKSAVSTAAFVAGGPAVSASLTGAATIVGGANLLMQITDDSCFVMMGDEYDNSEFVANLQKASDYVAPAAFAAGILTMNFSKAEDAVMASYDIAENFRGLFQEGKIAGIQFGTQNANMTVMTFDELQQYKQAQSDGQKLSKDIQELLDMLDSLENGKNHEPASVTATPADISDDNQGSPSVNSSTVFSGQYYAAGKLERCNVGATPDFVYNDILYTFYGDGSMTREKLEIGGRYEYSIQYYMIQDIDGKHTMVDQYGNIQYILEQQNGYIYLIQPDSNTVEAILAPASEEPYVQDDFSQFEGWWTFIDYAHEYGQIPEHRELNWNEQATLIINADRTTKVKTMSLHYEDGKLINGQYDPVESDSMVEQRQDGYYCSGDGRTKGRLLLHDNGYLYIELAIDEGEIVYQVFSK